MKKKRIIWVIAAIVTIIILVVCSLTLLLAVSYSIMRDPVENYCVEHSIPNTSIVMRLKHKRTKRFYLTFYEKEGLRKRRVGDAVVYLSEVQNIIEFFVLSGTRDTVFFDNKREDWIKDWPDKTNFKKENMSIIVSGTDNRVHFENDKNSFRTKVRVYTDAKDSVVFLN